MTATTQQQQAQAQPATEQYTRIVCDNVLWDRFKREHIRCARLLLRLRPGDVLTTEVEVVCSRCGKRQWVGG
jgi:hypothetical protein